MPELPIITEEVSFELAEKLFERKCSITAKKVRVISSALLKLSKIPKIQEILSDELEELKKLDKMEADLIESFHIL